MTIHIQLNWLSWHSSTKSCTYILWQRKFIMTWSYINCFTPLQSRACNKRIYTSYDMTSLLPQNLLSVPIWQGLSIYVWIHIQISFNIDRWYLLFCIYEQSISVNKNAPNERNGHTNEASNIWTHYSHTARIPRSLIHYSFF